MKALLLAGGQGTRLRPLTENLPKPLMPVMDRPWLEHLVLQLKQQGIDQIVVAVKYHADKIRHRLGDGRRLGVHIAYVEESEPLGTGGAIKNAEPLLGPRFLVVNADIIHAADLKALLSFHEQHGGLVTMGLTEVEDPSQYGVVEQAEGGRIVRFVEKPPRHEAPSHWINAGIYVMNREALQGIPAGREVSVEREVFPRLVERPQGVFGLRLSGYWLDMGTPERYLRLHRDVFNEQFRLTPVAPMRARGVWIGAAEIPSDVRLIPPVIIGDGAQIGRGAEIGPMTVIGERAVVGRGSKLSGAVVWPDALVPGGTVLRGGVIGRWFTLTVPTDGVADRKEALVQ